MQRFAIQRNSTFNLAFVGDNAVDNGLGQLPPIGRVKNFPAFRRMRHEAGFNQHSGHYGIAQHGEARPAHSPILHAKVVQQRALDLIGKI